jgi:hypothetical protein
MSQTNVSHTDETVAPLKPTEGVEYKLKMKHGMRAGRSRLVKVGVANDDGHGPRDGARGTGQITPPRPGPDRFRAMGREDQKSMPPPGIVGAESCFGNSAISASVVISSEAMEAASCSAVRTTLAGSITPLATRSWYSPVAAL